MKKVYLVSSGSYSDYSVDAIFSTKELAQAWLSKAPSSRWSFSAFNDIEEFDLDDMSNPPRPMFSTQLNMHTGNFLSFESVGWGGARPANTIYLYNNLLTITSDVPDKERAIKIASEKRAQLIALDRLDYGDYDYETLVPINLCTRSDIE